MTTSHPYSELLPERILAAIEDLGLVCDGRLLALNSYENRVYRVGIEDGPAIVAKFYRPGRWSDAAILEEHAFTCSLAAADLPVVAPLALSARGSSERRTLHHDGDFPLALFPLRGGHWRELEEDDDLRWMGRFIARIHAQGRLAAFRHRQTLTVESHGQAAYDFIRQAGFVPMDLEAAYRAVVEDCLTAIRAAWARLPEPEYLRLHGDCHLGNILWSDDGPHFVDFDDSMMGPAIQDLWMMLSGERDEQQRKVNALIDGYEEFADFDYRQLALIEPLRTLRMLNYSAWLGRRWDDPAFPHNFPWFDSQKYWEEQILALKEQLSAMAEPALERCR